MRLALYAHRTLHGWSKEMTTSKFATAAAAAHAWLVPTFIRTAGGAFLKRGATGAESTASQAHRAQR